MAFLPFALSAGMQRFFLRLEEFPALSRWRIPSVDPISRPHTHPRDQLVWRNFCADPNLSAGFDRLSYRFSVSFAAT